MFQITEAHVCYDGVLTLLKYITNWRPDSDTLSSTYVKFFMTWKSLFMDCETPKRVGVGMFCSYLLKIRKNLLPCYAVWCGECYHHQPEYQFLAQTSLSDEYNKSNYLETEERLNKRFHISRDRDHLMGIHFECDL